MANPSKRFAPTSETIKKLLMRSGNECAFPGCTEVLFNDLDKLIAECCHIEAALPGGERFNPNQTDNDRRSITNLLFLCHNHHIVTNDVSKYTVAILKKIKRDHESQFREKPITIRSNYIQQVIKSFEEIRFNVKQTSDTVKRIEKKQNEIINLISSQAKTKEIEADGFSEYFGVPPVFQFIGRNKELTGLKSVYTKYNTFFIRGLSGIGKTSLLAQFLIKVKSHKILWIDCKIVQTRELFYNHLAKFIRQEFSDRSIDRILSVSDDDDIIKTVITALQKHHTCIVLDGLDSNVHDLNLLLRPLNENLSVSKILISTTHHFDTISWRNPVYELSLKGLEVETFMEMLVSYNIPNVGPEHSIKLFHLLSGHPFLLKLCASILQYQPVEHFILQFENQGTDEIAEYVKRKVIETLSRDENDLLNKLSVFEIPFRYSIGNYILPQTFTKTIKVLQKKFLVEKFHSTFFIIPEFIRSYIIRAEKANIGKDIYTAFVTYLLSIRTDIRIIEKNALIYHALEADIIDVAKKETSSFLSYLLNAGKFNLAHEIARDLQNNPESKKWSFIYYTLGRVLRFQQEYEKSLENYEYGLNLTENIQEGCTFEFEIASILTYLSKELGDNTLMVKAISIYEKLSKSNDATLSLQSQLSLTTVLMDSGMYADVIKKLETLSSKINATNIQVNALAGMWQFLGDAYSKNEEYHKAFSAFDKSIDLYKEAIEKSGMNVIDGLYHLYESYGWTYANAGDYSSASEIFGICVRLCSIFDLGNYLEKSLFDYGFHLTMDHQYGKAVKVLTDHYAFIVANNLISESDMPFIHGTLAFAHWYSGGLIEAIELLGLYVLSCFRKNIQPVISLIEEDGILEKLDVLHFFNKRMYVLIIPSGKTYRDFNDLVNEVCSRRPELVEPLSQFHYYMKDADKS
jgi:tetratricopeptide (TPR) repeat protein